MADDGVCWSLDGAKSGKCGLWNAVSLMGRPRFCFWGGHAGERATVLLVEKGSGGVGGLERVGVLRLSCASLRMTGGRVTDMADGPVG